MAKSKTKAAGGERQGRTPFLLGKTRVGAGKRKRVDLPVGRLVTGTWQNLPVVVVHGREPGPRVWLSAAIHGDEINGVEIIRETLSRVDPRSLRGTLLAVPVVNVFGFNLQNRYLPDRRDLNRSFPGSAKGSMAARLAHLFLTEIVDRCEVGLDFHTGSLDRTNLPQIRADLEDPETRRLATAFAAPLMLSSRTLPGSLREAALERGKTILLLEAGEPLRFNRNAIAAGVAGTLRVLAALGMRPLEDDEADAAETLEGRASRWVRASRGGVFRLRVELGQRVEKGDLLGVINDPYPSRGRRIRAPAAGLVMGFTNNPLVHQGEALVHLAQVTGPPA